MPLAISWWISPNGMVALYRKNQTKTKSPDPKLGLLDLGKGAHKKYRLSK